MVPKEFGEILGVHPEDGMYLVAAKTLAVSSLLTLFDMEGEGGDTFIEVWILSFLEEFSSKLVLKLRSFKFLP